MKRRGVFLLVVALAFALTGIAVAVVLHSNPSKKPAEGVPASLQPGFKIRSSHNDLVPVAQHTTYCIESTDGSQSYSYVGDSTVGKMSLGNCP